MANVVDITTLCDAITTELSAADTVERAQDHDELTEGVSDTPLLQVYPDSGDTVSTDSGTDKMTLGHRDGTAPHRQERIVIIADYFASHRAHLGQDMGRLVAGIDAIRSKLKEQNNDETPFGVYGVDSFQWRWDRVTFEFGGANYVAARFWLTIRVAA
jgi:hypothetical protein